MTTTADPSAAYAAEVARLLWPDPWEHPRVARSGRRPRSGDRDAYLFPSRRRPRLLVPADLPGSSTMLRRLGSGRLAVPARRLLELSVRSGAVALAGWPVLRVSGTDPAADSIERYLCEHLGAEVRVGVMLGTRRVNQKPVLQVFGLDGTVLGYAKVGHTDLTAALVRREAEALATVTGLRPHSFRVPRTLHHARWSGLEVLVTSALTTSRATASRSARLAATREIIALAGTTRTALADSTFWSLRRQLAAGLAEADAGRRLQDSVRAIEVQHGTEVLTLGGWHGDWGAWNMGVADGVLQVWDWERYDPEVPAGFDALHFAAQSVRPGEREQHRQETTFLATVPQVLAEHGVAPPLHETTLRLYLLEVALRYVDALGHGATPALLRRTAWVLSLLESRLGTRAPLPTEGRP